MRWLQRGIRCHNRLRQVLNTLGLFNPHFTYLQGLVFGEEAVRATLHDTRARLSLEPVFSNLICSSSVELV
ncbi:hypothetical protein CRX42_04580 [Pseudomonas jessenii]|uniref:Uncharacterized protein n=1 Tax=Pseudomonas jessenii TaxID=77298 RepID=A0A2W0EV10_PSEJE|nr:hypothetical protein CRX42_04580 [Pseudomonas jessenii]